MAQIKPGKIPGQLKTELSQMGYVACLRRCQLAWILPLSFLKAGGKNRSGYALGIQGNFPLEQEKSPECMSQTKLTCSLVY